MNIKFSLEKFELAGKDTELARTLSDDLEKEVLDRLHEVIIKEIELIVNELNRNGHKLKLQYEPCSGDISYIDNNRLRLSVDTVVSCGFAHLNMISDDDL